MNTSNVKEVASREHIPPTIHSVGLLLRRYGLLLGMVILLGVALWSLAKVLGIHKRTGPVCLLGNMKVEEDMNAKQSHG